MQNLISVVHKSIHLTQEDDGKYSVWVYVNGKQTSAYGSGTREWAESLVELLVNDDCPRCGDPHFTRKRDAPPSTASEVADQTL